MIHNREKLYRYLWENADAYGVLQLPQGEVAKRTGISYQGLSVIFKEFVEMGLMNKNKHKFQLVYDPDRIPWGEKYDALRNKYVKSKKNVLEEQSC